MKMLLLLLLPALTRAQDPKPCGCARNLAEAQRLLATNYAGYRDKVTAATQPRLDSLVAAARQQADTARTAFGCEKVLRQYLGFFRDGHVQLTSTSAGKPNADSIRARYAGSPRLPWTRASFRAYLDDSGQPKRLLEGIWRDAGGGYEVGIVTAENGRYQGFVLRADSTFWVPGQVKFTLADPAAGPAPATYYMRNHAAEAPTARLLGEGRLDVYGPWYRQYPRPVPVPAPPTRHSFRMLDDTTALYRIASFGSDFRPKIDSLTRANAANLARTRLLVLDVRGNGGGSDGSYRSLLPYLYTRPVQTVNVALYSTPENNRKYNQALYPHMPLLEKLYYRHLRHRLNRQLGELVPLLRDTVVTERIPHRRQHPALAQIAVLQDGNCASTTEQFLLVAGQSGKVTTFGENSAGVLDYSNLQFAPLPCYNLRLGWSTSRSFRLDRGEGIDNVGLAPTVRLDPAAPDMVEQVRTWYRRRK